MKRFFLCLVFALFSTPLFASPQSTFWALIKALETRDLETCLELLSVKTLDLVEKGIKKTLEQDIKFSKSGDNVKQRALLEFKGRALFIQFLENNPDIKKRKLPDTSQVKILSHSKVSSDRIDLIAEVKPGKAYSFVFRFEKNRWLLDLAATIPDLSRWTTLWIQVGEWAIPF